MRSFSILATAALIGLPLIAQDDSAGQDRGSKLYEAQLLRASDLKGGLGTLGTAGKDPLKDGVVEVRAKRVVEVRLNGAASGKTYELFYCQFLGTTCKSLGSVETGENGNAAKLFEFAGEGDGWAGVFYLKGGTEGAGAVQFVGGWLFDPAAPATGGGSDQPSKSSVNGKVTAVDAAAKTLKVENFPSLIKITDETRFQGHRDFSEVEVGQVVEVDGYLNKDGSLTAVSVKLEKADNDNKPSDPPGKPDDKPGKN